MAIQYILRSLDISKEQKALNLLVSDLEKENIRINSEVVKHACLFFKNFKSLHNQMNESNLACRLVDRKYIFNY